MNGSLESSPTHTQCTCTHNAHAHTMHMHTQYIRASYTYMHTACAHTEVSCSHIHVHTCIHNAHTHRCIKDAHAHMHLHTHTHTCTHVHTLHWGARARVLSCFWGTGTPKRSCFLILLFPSRNPVEPNYSAGAQKAAASPMHTGLKGESQASKHPSLWGSQLLLSTAAGAQRC